MVTNEELPRDANGIVQGVYRILHERRTFHGTIGIYDMRDGASVFPAYGKALLAAVGEYGNEIYLEAWGKIDSSIPIPEMISCDVPAGVSLQICPWRAAPAPSDEKGDVEAKEPPSDGLDELTLEQLRDLAKERGIEVGNKKERAIVKLLRAAAPAPSDEKGDVEAKE